jgi:prophage regulatory protein
MRREPTVVNVNFHHEIHMTKNPTDHHHQILRLPDVIARTGMKRSWIYREMRAKGFPAAVKLGRASGWDATAIDEWIESRLSGGKA